MKSCQKWDKRLQRLERCLKIPKISWIIRVVDPSGSFEDMILGPNGLIPLPLDEKEKADRKEVAMAPDHEGTAQATSGLDHDPGS